MRFFIISPVITALLYYAQAPLPPVNLRSFVDEVPQMGDIAWTELTEGSGTSNPGTTASISPTSGRIVLVSIAVSVAGGGATGTSDSMSVSGCGLTWTQVGRVATFGTRRALYTFKGTGTPSSGTLSITFTSGGGETFESFKWGVHESPEIDSTTPFGTVYTYSTASAVTSATVTVSETPDTGDHVYAAFALEDNNTPTLNSELETALTDFGNTTGARRLVIAYDSTPDSTPAPGITWSPSCSAGGLAFIVNKAAGGAAGNPWYYYALQ